MATFGCYVAEVIIKNLGGKWVQTEKGQALLIPTANGNQIEVISPIIRMGKYFKNRTETVSWFYEMTKNTVKSN